MLANIRQQAAENLYASAQKRVERQRGEIQRSNWHRDWSDGDLFVSDLYAQLFQFSALLAEIGAIGDAWTLVRASAEATIITGALHGMASAVLLLETMCGAHSKSLATQSHCI